MSDDQPLVKLTNESGEWEYIPLTDEEIAEREASHEQYETEMWRVVPDRNALLDASTSSSS